MLTKTHVTLEEIKQKLSASPELIARLNEFAKVVVVSRGGFGAISVLSQFLKTRWYDTACISSYSEEKSQGEFNVHKLAPTDEEVLIVEDMVDTGNTAKFLKQKFPNSKVFSLHYKPAKSVVKPDFYLWETDEWIVYPWELD
jgi:xanthine phosphoribosyltransferase